MIISNQKILINKTRDIFLQSEYKIEKIVLCVVQHKQKFT